MIIINTLVFVFRGLSWFQIMLQPSVFLIFFTGLYCFLGLTYENQVFKLIQCLIIYLLALFTLLDNPLSFYSIGVWSALGFLAFSYGFLVSRRRIFFYILSIVIALPISLITQGGWKENSPLIFSFLAYFFIHVFLILLVFLNKVQLYEKEIENKKVVAEIGHRASSLIHDTKNFIQNISGSLYFLKDSTKEESEPYIQIISDTLKGINTKFESLLYLEKTEELNTFYMDTLLQSVVFLHTLDKKNKNITISVFSDENLDFKYKGRKIDFFILFDNLIKNGIEAGTSNTAIHITQNAEYIFLDFLDNGCGIKKCVSCAFKDCLECSHSSSKTTGHGMGTKSVVSVIREYRGTLEYHPQSTGMKISLRFPREATNSK